MNEQSRKRKQRALNTERGIPNRVPATEAAQHIARLRSTMSWSDLATSAGTSACHLRRILNGLEPRINRVTHNKILAVGATPGGWIFVDAIGTRRRIQALQAIGHSQEAIAKQAGSCQHRIYMISGGHVATVRLHLAERIAEAYRLLSPVEGTSTRSRNNAARNGWPGPAFWDDDDFDNPDFRPAIDDGNRNAQAAARLADIAHLASWDIPAHEIAARLDMSADYVTTKLRELRAAA